MEDYIGTRLLFETSKGIISGMLRIVDESAGKLVVEDGCGMKDVLIEDIQRLEAVEDPAPNPSADHRIKDGNAKEGTKHGESMPSTDSDDKSVMGKSIPRQHSMSRLSLKAAGIDRSVDERHKSSQVDGSGAGHRNDGNILSSDKTRIDGKESKHTPETSEENYYRMMERAFSHFGPLEEEFCSIAARQAYRIFSTYFESSSADVEIFISGDDVFAGIGFILGRLLLHSGKMSSIVCNESFVKNARYRQSYLNSGGVITSRPRGEPSIHIYACNKTLIPVQPKDSAKGFLYLDTPGFCIEEKETKIGLCFGSVPAYFRRFNGIMYFVDIEYPTALYEEFGLGRPIKSKIHKVK
ncbi:hypothetical protein M970_090280 [Encephalitozoon cuniculi EcunIII-L]|nr:hypothetical protein M970_090280 [Encephalitozoon cuniculi EcunIII-L]